jgi:WD repeat-containing protein 61
MELQVNKLAQLSGHISPIYTLESGFDTNIIFSGGGDQILASWNVENFQPHKLAIKLESGIYAICLIQEKNLVLIGNALGGIHVIDIQEKKELRLLKPHQAQVFDIKYSIKNNALYTCSHDGSISIYSLSDFSHQKTIKLCNEKVRQLALNKTETELAIACGDGSIRFFDTEAMEEKTIIKAHDLSCNCICYHPHEDFLLSGGRDAHLKLWDAKNYSLIKSIPAHNFALYKIAFGNSNNYFATASRDKTIKLWDGSTFELIKRLDFKNYRGHTHSVNTLLWDKSSGNLITAGDDKTIIVWEIKLESKNSIL